MNMPPPLLHPNMILELVYTLIIAIICFAIYNKTKESYNLTKLKSIKYFRNAFCVLGLSFILRLVVSIISISTVIFDVFISRKILLSLFFVPLGYLSTLGIFYLLFSFNWKNLKNKYALQFSHGIALFLAVISFLTRSSDILLYLQTILLLGALLVGFMNKSKKKITKTRQLYVLVFISWLINLWITVPRTFIPLGIKTILFILSTIVFFSVYYRVAKWLK